MPNEPIYIFNTLSSPGGVYIITSPYLIVKAPAVGELKGLMQIKL